MSSSVTNMQPPPSYVKPEFVKSSCILMKGQKEDAKGVLFNISDDFQIVILFPKPKTEKKGIVCFVTSAARNTENRDTRCVFRSWSILCDQRDNMLMCFGGAMQSLDLNNYKMHTQCDSCGLAAFTAQRGKSPIDRDFTFYLSGRELFILNAIMDSVEFYRCNPVLVRTEYK